MSNQPNDGDLDPEELERLINTAGRGDTARQSPLTALITAATTPDHTRVHAGEEPAVTAYLSANSQTPTAKPNRPLRHTRPATIAATLAALTALTIATLVNINGNSTPKPRHSSPITSTNSTRQPNQNLAPPRSPMSTATATYPNALPSPSHSPASTPPSPSPHQQTQSGKSKSHGHPENQNHAKHNAASS